MFRWLVIRLFAKLVAYCFQTPTITSFYSWVPLPNFSMNYAKKNLSTSQVLNILQIDLIQKIIKNGGRYKQKQHIYEINIWWQPIIDFTEGKVSIHQEHLEKAGAKPNKLLIYQCPNSNKIMIIQYSHLKSIVPVWQSHGSNYPYRSHYVTGIC